MGLLRLLLVDDHVLFREGLAALLDAEPDMKVVGQVGDVTTAVAAARRLRPDVILMDSRIPGGDGITATRSIRAVLPEARVIMLAADERQERVVEALLSGASGYLTRSVSSSELLTYLRQLARGEPDVTLTLECFRRLSAASTHTRLDALTAREREIVELVGQGATNKEIARELSVSINTIKTHVRHILEKLQVARRYEVGVFAARPPSEYPMTED